MMIQMIDKRDAAPIGQDGETLTFKALLYLNVAVDVQACRLFCMVYIPIAQPGSAWLPRYNEFFCC